MKIHLSADEGVYITNGDRTLYVMEYKGKLLTKIVYIKEITKPKPFIKEVDENDKKQQD